VNDSVIQSPPADAARIRRTGPSPAALWVATALVCGLVLIPTGWTWAQAARQSRAQGDRLARIAGSAQQLTELEARLPAWALIPKSTAALAPQVSAVLAAAGLPASAMTSLSAESASPASPGATVRAQARHATLVLSGLTLPQVGSFLQAWRQKQPAWTVSQIELSPEASAVGALGKPSSRPDTGGDLPLHAVLTLETLSLQRGGDR
jgi:hypothetical protein